MMGTPELRAMALDHFHEHQAELAVALAAPGRAGRLPGPACWPASAAPPCGRGRPLGHRGRRRRIGCCPWSTRCSTSSPPGFDPTGAVPTHSLTPPGGTVLRHDRAGGVPRCGADRPLPRQIAGELRRSVAWAGVYDPDAEPALASFAEATGRTVCRSEEEALDGCDAVYVCTWTSEHRRLVEAAAAAGPGGVLREAAGHRPRRRPAMAAACRRRGRRQPGGAGAAPLPGLRPRARPGPRDRQRARWWCRSATTSTSPVQGFYDSTWRGDPAKAGAGTLLEHSIHDVDLLEYVVGPIATVTAHSAEFHRIRGHRGRRRPVVPLRRRRRGDPGLHLARHAPPPQHAAARGDQRVRPTCAWRTTGRGRCGGCGPARPSGSCRAPT